MLTRSWFYAAFLIVGLSACKKKEEAPSPIASATAEPAAAPSPAAPAAEAPVASAAAPATSASAVSAQPASPTASAAGEAPKKASTGSSAAGIKACCNAIAAAAKKDTLNANRYQAAAAVCGGLAQSVAKGTASLAAARTTLRAQFRGVPIPGGC